MLPIRTRTIAASLTAVAALGAGGTAIAQSIDNGKPTTITVTPAVTLSAGTVAPFDAPGAPKIRRGKTIPAGYTLVGYHVTTAKGTKTAGAALRFDCPDGKLLRTFATTGTAGFQSTRDYVGHHSTFVIAFPSGRLTTSDGRVYAVCR